MVPRVGVTPTSLLPQLIDSHWAKLPPRYARAIVSQLARDGRRVAFGAGIAQREARRTITSREILETLRFGKPIGRTVEFDGERDAWILQVRHQAAGARITCKVAILRSASLVVLEASRKSEA